MRVTRAELVAFRGGSLPDLTPDKTCLLFVGINPGLRAVAAQTHFGGGGSNRFYPALYRAGIVNRLIDASEGLSRADSAHLQDRGIGITSLVAKASAKAEDITAAELLHGAVALGSRVKHIGPNVVVLLGITAYRTAFNQPTARFGRQPHLLEGAQVWVVPNPSGLNRRTSLADLASSYRDAALAADLELFETEN